MRLSKLLVLSIAVAIAFTISTGVVSATEGCTTSRPNCTLVDSGTCSQLDGTERECKRNNETEGNCCLPDITPPPDITPVVPPSAPHPPPYIPCGETNSPAGGESEFHSLRPYQASPCDTNLDASDLKLYCGNDLIIKDEITATQSGPGDVTCVDNGDGTISCDYVLERTAEIEVAIEDAELPILGNTQLVPNQINGGYPVVESDGLLTSFRLDWSTRMNEYLSWWLNGAPFRAEEELFDPYEIDEEYPFKHIYTHGGPIRNLYPGEKQEQIRRNRKAAIGSTRHNQIFICRRNGEQVPCRFDFDTNSYLVDVNNTPNDKTDDVSASYERMDSGSGENPWMLMSSTEDRIGTLYIDPASTIQPTDEEGNDVVITNLVFEPTNDTGVMFFPHIDEVIELTDRLQDTYTARDIKSSKGRSHGTEPRVTYDTERCDLEDVRWNSGDDLFTEIDTTPLGTITNPEGQVIPPEGITAEVTYTAEFSCTFKSDLTIQQCVTDCIAACGPTNVNCIEQCGPDCGNDECEKDAYIATSVYTRTPKAEELWERTVAGDASLVKRMYPKLGTNGMFDELKALPAVSTANYESDGDGTYAGSIDNQRNGNEAEIYFPYLGGIYEYTMKTMQDILRPQIMNSKYLDSGIPPGSGGVPVHGATCTYTDSDIDSAMNAAASKYGIPVSMLRAIFEIEGLDFIVDYQKDGQDVYTCDQNSAGAAGLMQVVGPSNTRGANTYTGITCESERLATTSNPTGDLGVCESEPGKLSRCDVDDIFELAARTILTKVGLWNSATCTATGRFNPTFANIYNASCNYYGTFKPESSTHNYATGFGNATMPNPLRECDPSTQYCMNYCDIVCNKMGTCPPYPTQEKQ